MTPLSTGLTVTHAQLQVSRRLSFKELNGKSARISHSRNEVDLSAVDYSAIPLESIERIEIIRNGGGVLYGDGAVSGTICTPPGVAEHRNTGVAYRIG